MRTQQTVLPQSQHQQSQGSDHKDGGLYNDQIEDVMNNYKQKGFKGVYAIDEIDKIPVSNKNGRLF